MPVVDVIGDHPPRGQEQSSPRSTQTHSVFAWDAGAKVDTVIADDEEGADVDVSDITNPRKPLLIAEHHIGQLLPPILRSAPANLTSVLLHDNAVQEIGGRPVVLAPSWDGGYVALDVTDPGRHHVPRRHRRRQPDPEAPESGLGVRPEGNAHQSAGRAVRFTLSHAREHPGEVSASRRSG